MKSLIQIAAWTALMCLSPIYGKDKTNQNELWYNKPAQVKALSLPWANDGASDTHESMNSGDVWESKTLPLGNGRVGATVYGGVHLDCVVLNEVSLWSGGQNTANNGSGYEYGPTSDSTKFGSYQPFAQLFVAFDNLGDISQYRRALNIRNAVATTSFTGSNGGSETAYKRECFVSKPDDVFVYHAEAEGSSTLNAKVALMPYHSVSYKVDGTNGLRMTGTLANGEAFEGRIIVLTEEGKVQASGGSCSLSVEYEGGGDRQAPKYKAQRVPYLCVTGARKFTILVSLSTSYKMDYAANWKGEKPGARNQRILTAAQKHDYKSLCKRHKSDFSALFNRLKLEIGSGETSDLPTDERLAHYKDSADDLGLEQLMFQYGRYLMISGSRPGNLPMNLQGIWNDKVHAAWACDYHTNINFQMCYWSAETANLSECHEPLLDYLKAMRKPLSEFTQQVYSKGTPGWVMRISLNPWGGVGWTMMYPTANAWFALHLWEHYQFTQDADFLKKTAYPIFKELCLFWEQNLKKLGAGGEGLVSNGKPVDVTQHPELKDLPAGTLVVPSGWSHEWGPTEDGVTHDQQLVRELFKFTAQAADALHTDAALAKRLRTMATKLALDRVGSGGYLQEWIVDRPDMVSGHRHTSHLFALFPGSTISKRLTPGLAEAAAKSLELRGLSADNRRSWTWPWRTALYARLHNGEKAYEMLQNLLRYNTLDNLMTSHPPMQMDGVLGMPGAVCEMLVQSHEGCIELLPALSPAWKDGKATGLRARGGLIVDLEWKDGKVTSFSIQNTIPAPQPVKVLSNGEEKTIVPEYNPKRSAKPLKAASPKKATRK